MNAEQIKTALRGRHPAVDGPMVGPWTCLEEFRRIDLLAVSAWSSHRYRRVGYEVKASRGDFRAELLKPRKRAWAVGWCHEFYFAVPQGLLRPEEIAWREPAWEPGDFRRTPCRFSSRGADAPQWRDSPGVCHRGKRETLLTGPLTERTATFGRPRVEVVCDGCGGKGYAERSRVEREAPQLWIPADVGLITVNGTGTHVVRRPPTRPRDRTQEAADAMLSEVIRWASVRPDPRHVEAFLRVGLAYEQIAKTAG